MLVVSYMISRLVVTFIAKFNVFFKKVLSFDTYLLRKHLSFKNPHLLLPQYHFLKILNKKQLPFPDHSLLLQTGVETCIWVPPFLISDIVEAYLSFVLTTLSMICLAATLVTYAMFSQLRNLPGLNLMALAACTLAYQVTSKLFFGGKYLQEVKKYGRTTFFLCYFLS